MLLSYTNTSTTLGFQLAANFNINNQSTLLPKSLFPGFDSDPTNTLTRLLFHRERSNYNSKSKILTSRPISIVSASLIEAPLLWAGRVCLFYALLKAGLAGSPSNPLLSDFESGTGESAGFGFSKWLDAIQRKPDKEAAAKRKLVSKWRPTTRGTLRRNYRVPSKADGQCLLKAVAALLSDDDHFVDATSHKGCQIRRESAHGESVCCNNVRALYDELPTPHLIVEITPFPAGPLTEKDYVKTEKLEKVLRSSPHI